MEQSLPILIILFTKLLTRIIKIQTQPQTLAKYKHSSNIGVTLTVLNTTFNNISVISLVEETAVPRENHRPVASN